MADEIVILITTSSEAEAQRIGRALVEEHLVACANIIPAIKSIFFWEGKTQETAESLMVCKSRSALMDRITSRVREMHSYTVPEIIAIPIEGGLPEYLAWVRDTAKGA
ncbi:MAG: divalent-cation tolerance protein CutA [Nitrospiraceae bacterium]|nr:divalent-cation tolerance protein CutA [Nitrospiraceae bacterium]